MELYADFTFYFLHCIKTTLYLANLFSDALDKTSVDGTSSKTTEELFDCVICGQTSASTEERPIGLVALLQPTAGKATYSSTFLSKHHPLAANSKYESDGSLD